MEELDITEFIAFISREILKNEGKEELVEAYHKFCGNEDGSMGITLKQLQETMEHYGEKRLEPQDFEALFSETDYDNDGFINFEDFVRMMMSK